MCQIILYLYAWCWSVMYTLESAWSTVTCSFSFHSQPIRHSHFCRRTFDVTFSSCTYRFKSGHGGKVEGDGSAGGAATDQALAQTVHHQQYLGDATQCLPQFEELEFGDSLIPECCTIEDVKELQDIYREHCEVMGRKVMFFLCVVKGVSCAIWTYWNFSQNSTSQVLR